jgi:hypothetical protein
MIWRSGRIRVGHLVQNSASSIRAGSLCTFFSEAFRCGARTAKGRFKGVNWLKTLENRAANLADRNDAMAIYIFN